jgi:outer membrane protein
MWDSQPYEGAGGVARVFPFVSYRGEQVEWYGPLLRTHLVKGSKADLFVQARLQFPAYEEDDSPLLEGLGDRSYTLITGITGQLNLNRVWQASLGVEVESFRAYDGIQAQAALTRKIGSPRSPFPVFGSIQAGIIAQNRDWVNYMVGVGPNQSRIDRPAYAPDASIHPFVQASAIYRLNSSWSLNLTCRVDFLDQEWTDSPLIRQSYRANSFLSASYSF